MLVGSRTIAVGDVTHFLLHPDPDDALSQTIWFSRVPRTVLILVAGAALGVAGTLMQVVTRHPMTDPGLLGVNAGASLAVVVGLRPGGPSWHKAYVDGFAVAEPAEAVRNADLIAVLTPDMTQPGIYKDAIEANIKPGATLPLAHRLNVNFGQIQPRKDLVVAPGATMWP